MSETDFKVFFEEIQKIKQDVIDIFKNYKEVMSGDLAIGEMEVKIPIRDTKDGWKPIAKTIAKNCGCKVEKDIIYLYAKGNIEQIPKTLRLQFNNWIKGVQESTQNPKKNAIF